MEPDATPDAQASALLARLFTLIAQIDAARAAQRITVDDQDRLDSLISLVHHSLEPALLAAVTTDPRWQRAALLHAADRDTFGPWTMLANLLRLRVLLDHPDELIAGLRRFEQRLWAAVAEGREGS